MSFGVPELSDSMMKAINYATRKGVVCLASVGNDGQTTLMYPAAYGNVVGVASVNSSNQASTFTNTGPDMVALAAPGEGLITTYPGNHYAIVSGTSFSVALVSGAADVLLSQVAKKGSAFQPADIARALKQANPCVTDDSLGAGCFDMSRAMAYIQRTFVPPPSVTSTK
jgi:subtilisin family serine protease